MAQTMLVFDSPNQSAVVQSGQPPAKMGAWLIDVPDGKTALEAAQDFVSSKSFPTGTLAYVFDPAAAQKFRLEPTWTPEA